MPRVSSDHLAARRRRILDGARACFTRFGYEGATVRRLEQSTGLSRGAIFHHYRDKDALFLALARRDAEQRMADVVAAQGLVQVMRELLADPDGDERDWLGTRLEVSRRLRTDPQLRGALARSLGCAGRRDPGPPGAAGGRGRGARRRPGTGARPLPRPGAGGAGASAWPRVCRWTSSTPCSTW